MQVTVFGASGKVGRRVVAELLQRGHTVVAAIHRHSPFDQSTPNLRTVSCDIHNAEQVLAATQGSQVIISALGSWGTPSKDIQSSAIANIVPAMQQTGSHRIISLTGAGAIIEGDKPRWLDRCTNSAMTLVAGKILRDGENHIGLLQVSGLDWTVLRSPVMTPGKRAQYTLQNTSLLPWATIPRAAVVQAIVDQIDDITHFKQSPFIKRS